MQICQKELLESYIQYDMQFKTICYSAVFHLSILHEKHSVLQMKQGNMLENLVVNIYFIKIIDNNMKIDNNNIIGICLIIGLIMSFISVIISCMRIMYH